MPPFRIFWSLFFPVGYFFIVELFDVNNYGRSFGFYVISIAVPGAIAGTLLPAARSSWRTLELVVMPLVGLGISHTFCCGHPLTLLGPGIASYSCCFAITQSLRSFPQLTPKSPIFLTLIVAAAPLLYYGPLMVRLATTPSSGVIKSTIATGQVVNAEGVPQDGYDVAAYWSSNGAIWDQYGNYAPPKDTEWSNEGDMEPLPRDMALSLPSGCFLFEFRHGQPALFAVSEDRKLGGLVVVNADTEYPVQIVGLPLARVHGTIQGSDGVIPQRIEVGICPKDGSRHNYFVVCNSSKGEFLFHLPPGEYELGARSFDPAGRYLKTNKHTFTTPDMRIDRVAFSVPVSEEKVELGMLEISNRNPVQ